VGTPRAAQAGPKARRRSIAAHFHGDPADQLIAATAIELDVPLLTADERFRALPALRTVW
jgi:PIN domain nuclease of toxin-antitoxin system